MSIYSPLAARINHDDLCILAERFRNYMINYAITGFSSEENVYLQLTRTQSNL